MGVKEEDILLPLDSRPRVNILGLCSHNKGEVYTNIGVKYNSNDLDTEQHATLK